MRREKKTDQYQNIGLCYTKTLAKYTSIYVLYFACNTYKQSHNKVLWFISHVSYQDRHRAPVDNSCLYLCKRHNSGIYQTSRLYVITVSAQFYWCSSSAVHVTNNISDVTQPSDLVAQHYQVRVFKDESVYSSTNITIKF